MTKEQFLEKYGQPKTFVSFKNKEELNEFLELCESFNIRWNGGAKATEPVNTNITYLIEIDKSKRLSYTDDKVWALAKGYQIIKYNSKSSTVDKVFEMLGVKPNEEFIFRQTKYHIDEELRVWLKGGICSGISSNLGVGTFLLNPDKIKKLPPKPLLTEEEKAFLKGFEFEKLEVGETLLYFELKNGKGRTVERDFIKHRFDGLELGRKYTREELGL